jgi:hypothetical protein
MDTKPSQQLFIAGLIVVSMIGVIGMGGCQKQLFPDKKVRTQFETHDRLRQSGTPTQEPDVFGQPQPALRARLGPQG